MPAAIAKVFPSTIHRLCKWHILNKFGPPLNELYTRFANREFKGKLHYVINHPLTVNEFEAAWKMLVVDEFGLGEHPRLKTLYDHRAQWVPSYFNSDYCGTMVSTQRGESESASEEWPCRCKHTADHHANQWKEKLMWNLKKWVYYFLTFIFGYIYFKTEILL